MSVSSGGGANGGFSSSAGGGDVPGQPGPTSAGGAAAAADAEVALVEMSGYFLVRAGKEDERFQLPLRETVVGRDSVRDKAPANRNKLRVGIPSSLEVSACGWVAVVVVAV